MGREGGREGRGDGRVERVRWLADDLVLLTLVGDLDDGPQGLVALLALVAGGLGVFHLVGEFEERVFEVGEAWGWGFACPRAAAADGGHVWVGGVVVVWCG